MRYANQIEAGYTGNAVLDGQLSGRICALGIHINSVSPVDVSFAPIVWPDHAIWGTLASQASSARMRGTAPVREAAAG